MYRTLIINPGSTSTRLAVFEDETERYAVTLAHGKETLDALGHVLAELPLRRQAVLDALAAAGLRDVAYDAVVGRGGMLRPVPSGTYAINALMLADAADMRSREHAANLGAIVADELARRYGVPAYVVDPVSVDEFEPLSRVAGLPGIERRSLSHALNLKATARRAAAALGRPYERTNLVVAHMGGGSRSVRIVRAAWLTSTRPWTAPARFHRSAPEACRWGTSCAWPSWASTAMPRCSPW